MRHRRSTDSPVPHRLILGGLLALGSACGDEPVERPPIVWKGEHLQVGTGLDIDAWCPGTLSRLDRYTGALKELFDAPADQVVSYYVYPPPLSDHEVCLDFSLGCSSGGAAFSIDPLLFHEVVHAISWTHGYMPHFFEEGSASYWGWTPSADFRGLDVRDVLDRLWSDGLDNRAYALAAHFTSYLVHTQGIEPYIALLRGSSRGQPRAEFEALFEQTFGITLDDAIDDYEEQWPYCNVSATQSSFYECAEPAQAILPGATVEFDLDISCADPDVIGPSSLVSEDRMPTIWREITVEVERSEHTVTFDVPELGEPNTVALEIKRCDTDCGVVMFNSRELRPDGTGIADSNLFSFTLLPGRYVLRVSRAADDPGPVRFSWRSAG